MLFKSVWFAYVKYNPVILLWLVIVKSIVLTSDVFVIVSNEFVKLLLLLFVMIEIKLIKFDAFVISNKNWLSVKFCCLNNCNWFFKETTVLIVFV